MNENGDVDYVSLVTDEGDRAGLETLLDMAVKFLPGLAKHVSVVLSNAQQGHLMSNGLVHNQHGESDHGYLKPRPQIAPFHESSGSHRTF